MRYQSTFSDVEYLIWKRIGKREEFLDSMNEIVPGDRETGLIKPFYPNGNRGRPRRRIETVLRMYLLQIWFNLSDGGIEDAIYDSSCMRKFMGLDFLTESVPDATTLLKFRHLLEKQGLGNKIHKLPCCYTLHQSEDDRSVWWIQPGEVHRASESSHPQHVFSVNQKITRSCLGKFSISSHWKRAFTFFRWSEPLAFYRMYNCSCSVNLVYKHSLRTVPKIVFLCIQCYLEQSEVALCPRKVVSKVFPNYQECFFCNISPKTSLE